MRPLRIAMISEHASPLATPGGIDAGGQNVYVAHLATELGRRGHRVDVFTRRDDPRSPEVVATGGGVRVIHVAAGPPASVPKEHLLPFMGEFARSLVRATRVRRYDILHANFFLSALVAADVKRELGVPFVVSFHALGLVRRIHQGADDGFPAARIAIELRAVAEADRIVASCPQEEDDLLRLYEADPGTIATVPCGYDPSEFSPMDRAVAREQLGLGGDGPLLLQLGRLVPRKGVDDAIRAMARLRDRHAIGARLLIVGGGSRDPESCVTPEVVRLRQVASAEGVADRVTLVGSRGRDELRAYYAAADVFVTTPHYEPFGITPIEAMACGRPVIGSAVGGIRSTVLDGETGYLVPPRDPAAIADRAARLLRDPEAARRMGLRAIRHVASRYTWRHVAQAVEGVYQSVISEALPGRRATTGLIGGGRG